MLKGLEVLFFRSERDRSVLAPMSLAEAGRQASWLIVGSVALAVMIVALSQVSDALGLCLLELQCRSGYRATQITLAGVNLFVSIWFVLLLVIGVPRLFLRAFLGQVARRRP